MSRWWNRLLPGETRWPTPTTGLTGDDLIDALIPLADHLVKAVHADNDDVVSDIVNHATALVGDPLPAAHALLVICAGMCSEDHGPKAALGWTLNRGEYRRQRKNVDALTASLRAGREALSVTTNRPSKGDVA